MDWILLWIYYLLYTASQSSPSVFMSITNVIFAHPKTNTARHYPRSARFHNKLAKLNYFGK